jgi:DNA polymerase-2
MQLSGWLLDAYAGRVDTQDGVVLWLLGDDGRRHRLVHDFPVTFYASGSSGQLRAAWRFLQDQPYSLQLERSQRRDLFVPHPLDVLGVSVERPSVQPHLFHQVEQAFPRLTYYDADIPLALRYAARYQLFPLARLQVIAGEDGHVQEIHALDSPWDLDPPQAPLRVLSLEPDSDPAHAEPAELLAYCGRYSYRLSFSPLRPLLVNLRAILKRHDPDLLLTTWGDTWLLPRLLELAEEAGLPLPFNRDESCEVSYRPERSYFSYGQVIYRGRQVHLAGRWHIDRRNAMLWGDYEIEGVLEMARVTALPVQTAARVSPGTGISAMQMLTALRQGILVPWHKQQVEHPKAALELFASDQGGLVYQPQSGLHRDVAGIDFVSMYPGIMVHFNISPETTGAARPEARSLARLEAPSDSGRPGLVPQTLAPLLQKRLALKARLTEMPRWDPERSLFKARSAAHKWLLVTCFGYLGYKNARFGRIEAHEAVTAYGREALLQAKEVAEDLGFTVLHLYVDGLWVQKPGTKRPADFQPLLDAIQARTGLPIALDGVYRWVAFLTSRANEHVPVANRYFGVFQDGSFKIRGIEARRRDTPAFVGETQLQILEEMRRILQEIPSGPVPPERLAPVIRLLRRRLRDLRAGGVRLEALLVKQKLSRELDAYRSPSAAARAAAQLQAAGKSLRPGQSVRFVYTLGKPGVHAWDLPEQPDPASVDVERYTQLLLRAAASVLEPLGIDEDALRDWVVGGVQPGDRRRMSLFDMEAMVGKPG